MIAESAGQEDVFDIIHADHMFGTSRLIKLEHLPEKAPGHLPVSLGQLCMSITVYRPVTRQSGMANSDRLVHLTDVHSATGGRRLSHGRDSHLRGT